MREYGVCVSEHLIFHSRTGRAWNTARQDSYLPMSSVAFLLGTRFFRLLNLYDIDKNILLTKHMYVRTAHGSQTYHTR